jgi:hypothetical protein
MSLLELMMWNPAWDFINKRFWRPVSGPMLSKLVHFEEPLVTRCGYRKQHSVGNQFHNRVENQSDPFIGHNCFWRPMLAVLVQCVFVSQFEELQGALF